jgi:hypothetical protein
MELKRGRLIDHLHLKVHDLGVARAFYGAVLAPLGIDIVDGEAYFFADELWVDKARRSSTAMSTLHSRGPIAPRWTRFTGQGSPRAALITARRACGTTTRGITGRS